MSEFRQPAHDSYHVRLREFDWVNAPEGEDPHYWTIGDITLGGRSILEDLRGMRSDYGARYMDWGTVFGYIAWQRNKEDALEYARKIIEYHRSHYYISVS